MSTRIDIPLANFPSTKEYHSHISELEQYLRKNAKSMSLEEVWWNLDLLFCIQSMLDKKEHGESPSLRFDIQAIAINDQWCLIAMPHEIFSGYQHWIEKVFPFKYKMVLGYTNACESYVMTDEDIEEACLESIPFGGPSLKYHSRSVPKIGIEQIIKEELSSLMTNILKWNFRI